ncbi:MAG: LamG domain-containing protein [Kofleriaceae bacterium]
MLRSFAALALVAGCRAGFDPVTRDRDSIDAGSVPLPIDAPTQPATPALLMWLPMDDGIADGMANDASGNNNNAWCVDGACPREVPGHNGLALAGFSSLAPGIELADAPHWRLATFSLTAWVKLMNPGSYAAIVSKPLGGGTANSFQLQIRNTGDLSCVISDGVGEARVTSTTSIPLDAWTHTACTYDGAQLRLYVMGQQVATPVAGIPLAYDEQSVFIGADRNAGQLAAAFDGHIDDVRIYAESLAPETIATLAE